MSFVEDDKNKEIRKETEEIELVEEVGSEIVPAKQLSIDENEIKKSIISKINEMDMQYKQGTLNYTEKLHRYNIEIEKIKSEIDIENIKNLEDQKILFAAESILEYESKAFETLHHKFIQKVESVVELRDEYKESLEEHVYNEKYARKKRELSLLVDDIEEKEMSLLNKELEKINLSNAFSQKLKRVEELKVSLQELELEKGYFESTELQKLSYLQPEQLLLKGEETQIVDTVITNEK